MRFHIDGEVQPKWIYCKLQDVLNYLETNTFWFPTKEDQRTVQNFLKAKKLLSQNTYQIYPKFVQLANPLDKKENLIAFNVAIEKKKPIVEDDSSFVLVDLDLKNLRIEDREDGDRDFQLRHIAETLLVSYANATPDCMKPDSIFNKGLIFIKTSYSGKGIHMLFRIKATEKTDDIKAYGIEIGKRLVEEFGLDIFSTDVFDTKVFGDNWNMYLNHTIKDTYFINREKDFLEVNEKTLEENLKMFNNLKGFRDGKIKTFATKEKDYSCSEKTNIDKIWYIQCGKMDMNYITGNQNKIFYFITSVKTEEYTKEELIEWFEKNKPEMIDCRTVFQQPISIREKIEAHWDKAEPFPKKLNNGKSDTKNVFDEKGHLNAGILEQYMQEFGFKRLLLSEKGEVTQHFLVFQEGNEITKLDFSNFVVNNIYTNFLFNILKIEDPHKQTIINKYISGSFNTLALKTIDYDSLLLDNKDVCYIITAQGPIEIRKDSHKLLENNNRPYFKRSIAGKWAKTLMVTGNIKYDPTLDNTNWKDRTIFDYVGGHDSDKLRKLTGYLIHRHKQENYNIVYMDNTDSTKGKDGGSTGKTLMSYMLCPIRFTSNIDQPNTTGARGDFWLSEFKIGSDVLIVNEAPKSFTMEKLRSIRDMALTIECKGEGRINLGVLTPKCLLTTNYVILSDLYADVRRCSSVLFDRRILIEDMKEFFGHVWFYEEHDDEWWSRYLLMMIECVQLYLNDSNIKYAVDEKVLIQRKMDELHNEQNDAYVYEAIYNYVNQYKHFNTFLTTEEIRLILNIDRSIFPQNRLIYKYLKDRILIDHDEKISFELELEKTGERRRGFILKTKHKLYDDEKKELEKEQKTIEDLFNFN